MYSNLINSNLFTLLLFVISGFLLYYFYPYLTKKGQNKADIQDSAQLTKIIESIKAEFSSKIELLRTDLQLMSNYRIEHRNEERKALIEFHRYLNEWLNRCILIDVSSYHINNCRDVLLKRTEIMELREKCLLAHSTVELIIKNEQLISISGKLVVEGVKFFTYTEKFLLDLYYNLDSRNLIYEKFLDVFKDLEQQDVANRLANSSKILETKQDELVLEFFNSKVEKYSPITTLLDEFNKLAKTYLTEIH